MESNNPTMPNVLEKRDVVLAVAVILGSIATFAGSIVLSNRLMKKQMDVMNASASFQR